MATTRLTIRKKDETDVLLRSRRICGFCAGLKRDFSLKVGQIAHLDRNNANRAFENLMFMCIPHHDQYDSTTSQSKNLTIGEAKAFRERVYAYVAGEAHDDTLRSVQFFIKRHLEVAKYIHYKKEEVAADHELQFMDSLSAMTGDALSLAATCFNRGVSSVMETLGGNLNLLYELLATGDYVVMPTRRKFDNSEVEGNDVQSILGNKKELAGVYSAVIHAEFWKLQQFAFNLVHIEDNGDASLIVSREIVPDPLKIYRDDN